MTGGPEGNAGPRVRPRTATIQQGDRAKAYRPIDREARMAALEAAIAAYDQGDFFEAHELLEPAWMGTSNLAERHLYQGLIKVAAGYVHCVRGNPIGMARNLEGARQHLATSLELEPGLGPGLGIDVAGLLTQIDIRLASARSAAHHLDTDPSAVRDLASTAPRLR